MGKVGGSRSLHKHTNSACLASSWSLIPPSLKAVNTRCNFTGVIYCLISVKAFCQKWHEGEVIWPSSDFQSPLQSPSHQKGKAYVAGNHPWVEEFQGFCRVGNTACWSWGSGSPPPSLNQHGAKYELGLPLDAALDFTEGENILCQQTKPTGKWPTLALPAGLHGGRAPVLNGWTFSLKILTTCLIVLVLKSFQLYHVPEKAN